MTAPKNIAIIAGQLVVGGAERQLYLWLSNLDRNRFNPIVITLHPGYDDYWEGPIEALGIPLYRIAKRGGRLMRLWEIIRTIRPHQPVLIHGWHLFASAYAGLAAKFLGAKCLGGVRNTFETFKAHNLESKMVLWLADGLVANSQRTADPLQAFVKRGDQKVFAVQNAVVDNFIDRGIIRKKLLDQFGLPDDDIWIVSVGRLEPLKRFDWLMLVIKKINSQGRRAHLLLIGDGPERGALETLAQSSGIADHVTFTGEIPMASQWLKAFDILAFPSVDEGLPNVIMEGAAAGLPIVTWQLPFYKELLADEVTALLVEPENLDEFTSAIIRLMDDCDLRKSIGTSARQHMLTSFGVERYVREMTEAYEQVLGSNKADLGRRL